jgi:hypothetical protein
MKGRFTVQHEDSEGNLKAIYRFPNGVVDEGMELMLDAMFNGTTSPPTATWYMGLVDNSGFSTFADADTLSSHAGWNETTNYTGNRQQWNPDPAATRSVTNPTVVSFTIGSGGDVIKGIFVCTVATGAAGVLWATAAFASTVTTAATDVLKVTYTVSG